MLTSDKKPAVSKAGKPLTTNTMSRLTFRFHPITTVRRSVAWVTDLISAIIDHIVVLTFYVAFSIITLVKNLSPETRQRIVDIVKPTPRAKQLIARYGILPPSVRQQQQSPARKAKDDGRQGRPPLPPRKNQSQQTLQFLPLTSDSDDDHRHHHHRDLHNHVYDGASDTVVGSVHDLQLVPDIITTAAQEGTEDGLPSPTESTSTSSSFRRTREREREEEMQRRLNEAEQEAKEIKSRAQKLADGMVSSASALHDTWIQDAHRQYSSIVGKAAKDVDKLTAESETLRAGILAMQPKHCVERGTQTEKQDTQDDSAQTAAVEATPVADTTTQTSEEQLVLSRPSSPLGTPRKYSSLITDRDVAAPMPSTPSRPSTSPMNQRPYTSTGTVTGPITPPMSRLSSQRRRPKSMDVVETLASLSPASYKQVMEEVAHSDEKEKEKGTQTPPAADKEKKRGVVKGLVEKGHRLFHHQHSASDGGLAGVARSSSNKLKKENRKSMGSDMS